LEEFPKKTKIKKRRKVFLERRESEVGKLAQGRGEKRDKFLRQKTDSP